MKTSKRMQQIITKIAEKHGLDLNASQGHLRLDMEGFDRLVIGKALSNLVTVAHYYEGEGGLVPDPEVMFFTGYGEWVPIEITQVLGGYRTYAVLDSGCTDIEFLDRRRQAELARFTEIWARNLEDQGWLEHGQKYDPPDQNPTTPGLETLMRWETEGGCEATDGCWVEPDGTCPHGCQSWLLVMGLI